MKLLYILIICCEIINCYNHVIPTWVAYPLSYLFFNEKGNTIRERILCPNAYERVYYSPRSIGYFLQNIKLKSHGSKVYYYNGEIKKK